MREACCWRRLREPDPVFLFEHAMLYPEEGEVDEGAGPADIRHAAVRRPGGDVTLITYGGSLGKALRAAEQLATEGIQAEVIDLRVLRPLDTPTILASVAKTHRAVIIDEGWRTGASRRRSPRRSRSSGFYDLDGPVARVCSAEVPMPYAKHLEDAALPQCRDDRRTSCGR